MSANEPDDALTVEVFLQPLNRRQPSQGIDDLVNGTPYLGGGAVTGHVEYEQGHPEGFEVGPYGGRRVGAGIILAGTEDQKDRAPLIAGGRLQPGQGDGIGPAVEAKLQVSEAGLLQLICQALATDGLGVGKGEEAGVASWASGRDGADDPDEYVVGETVVSAFFCCLLYLDFQRLQGVINRRAANDHQLGCAFFDISYLGRLPLYLEPTMQSLCRREGFGVVNKDGQGRQVQAEVAAIALAEDQLFADDDMIGESDLCIENMEGRRVGSAKVDR